jgi:hypothetical protein
LLTGKAVTVVISPCALCHKQIRRIVQVTIEGRLLL